MFQVWPDCDNEISYCIVSAAGIFLWRLQSRNSSSLKMSSRHSQRFRSCVSLVSPHTLQLCPHTTPQHDSNYIQFLPADDKRFERKGSSFENDLFLSLSWRWFYRKNQDTADHSPVFCPSRMPIKFVVPYVFFFELVSTRSLFGKGSNCPIIKIFCD